MNLMNILDPLLRPHPANFITRLGRYFYKSVSQESSGCVVVNKKDEVLLIHRGGIYQDWSFPKEKIENNRDRKEEALRETYEETGLRPKIITALPANYYSFYVDEKKIKVSNTVHLFLAKHVDGQRIELQAKNPDKKEANDFLEAKWIKISKAISLMRFPREAEILNEAKKIIDT